jgi:hypothetical protein
MNLVKSEGITAYVSTTVSEPTVKPATVSPVSLSLILSTDQTQPRQDGGDNDGEKGDANRA